MHNVIPVCKYALTDYIVLVFFLSSETAFKAYDLDPTQPQGHKRKQKYGPKDFVI